MDLLAQAPGMGRQLGQMLLWVVPLMVIFYFLLIRPQQKRERERQSLIASVQKNDRVVTVGGIHGVVTAIHDNEVTLKVDEDNNVRLKFSRSSVARIVKPGEDEGEPAVKVEHPGVDRQKAASDFAASAGRSDAQGLTCVFGFRSERDAVKAGENCPADAKRLLVDKPSVQVYTDGTCNLFLVLDAQATDRVLVSLAKKIKKAGGEGFMGSTVSNDLRNQMTGIFGPGSGLQMGM